MMPDVLEGKGKLPAALGHRYGSSVRLVLLLPALVLGSDLVVGPSPESLMVPESLADSLLLVPHITFGGATLAIIFAGALIAVIWWLLAVPRQVPAVAAHARRIVSAIRRIVVPVNMHTNWERAVELACRLGEDQKAEILLTSVIEVPFTLSLGAPSPKAELEAKSVLERASAIVEHHGLKARTQVERARQVGEGIARLARDEDADLIVMATPKIRTRLPGFASRVIETLLHRAPCEVIIDSAPEKPEEPVLGPAEPSADRT